MACSSRSTRMSHILEVDRSAGRVRVQAGIRLHALNEALAGVGLAMPNLGDIDRQSIAGAIATATHGTGLGLGNLATTVVAMEIVTGTGDVVRLDERSDPELLRVARVGVGALGIVTEVTLQCVPAFNLHARETIESLDDVLDGLAEQAAAVDHFELYWMPAAVAAARSSATRAPTNRPARSRGSPTCGTSGSARTSASGWSAGSAGGSLGRSRGSPSW